MEYGPLRSFMRRHRFAIRDLSLILVFALIALYFAYEVDVFSNEGGVSVHEATIELDEALLIGALVATALLIFGVRQYRSQKREMARRIAAERHAREMAYQDGLTGLPNRRQYDEALKAAVASPPRAGCLPWRVSARFERFQEINDINGHGVGDEALVIVGQRAAFRHALGGTSSHAFGGDEFAVLAQHLAGPEAATTLALRVHRGARFSPSPRAAPYTASARASALPLVPSMPRPRKKPCARPMWPCIGPRRSGVPRCDFFEPAMDARVHERSSLEAALRDAMDSGRIEATYQPTVESAKPQDNGFEIVPRWIDGSRGPVALERFIAIAEEVGLIHALAEQMLRQACQASKSWPSYIQIAIDIYPSQLKDHLLPARILKILDEFAIAPGSLGNRDHRECAGGRYGECSIGARRAAQRRGADCTGQFRHGLFKPLSFANFQLDKIKIDSSFIHTLTSEQASAGIVSALVGFGPWAGPGHRRRGCAGPPTRRHRF